MLVCSDSSVMTCHTKAHLWLLVCLKWKDCYSLLVGIANEPGVQPYRIKKTNSNNSREDYGVIGFHILYNAHHIAMATMYHYKSQIQFHCYMYGIICSNSTMYTVARAYRACEVPNKGNRLLGATSIELA